MDLKALSLSLGLSPTTVSRALNGYSDVSEVTRARVIEAAARVGYQPNAYARRLAMGRADAVGMVYPPGSADLADPRFTEVVTGLSERLQSEGIDLLIATSPRAEEISTYERLVRGRRFDALIVARTRRADPRLAFLQGQRFPFLAYGRCENPDGYAWFDFDHAAGSMLALRRLRAFGHRRVAYLHGGLEHNDAHERHAGFRRGLAELGLEENVAWTLPAEGRHGGREAMRALLALPQAPSAVIVDHATAGAGVAQALGERGLVPGRDVSVIVFDGVPPEQLLPGQAMTAIEHPTGAEAGRAMAAMILDVLAGKPAETLQQLWAPALMPGNSDGPVKAP
jgi:LacI family transcriptional regulator